jgi:hypothetical protein
VVEHIEGLPVEEGDTVSKEAFEKTTFPALICHSDAEGGYLSFEQLGIVATKDTLMWADLDTLRLELKRIGEYRDRMPDLVSAAYDDLLSMIVGSGEGDIAILFFY